MLNSAMMWRSSAISICQSKIGEKIMKLRIQKRAEAAGGLPSATNAEYVPGSGGIKNKSIPIDYWVIGELVNPITVGQSVRVLRESRNGVACPGVFQTSPIVEVTPTTFKTQNSIYDYLVLTNDANAVSLVV